MSQCICHNNINRHIRGINGESVFTNKQLQKIDGETVFIKGEIYTYRITISGEYELSGKFKPGLTGISVVGILPCGLDQITFDMYLIDLEVYRSKRIETILN